MPQISRCKPLLGTYVVIRVEAPVSQNALMGLCDEAFAKIELIQRLMSFHDTNSELSFLNREASHRPCPLSSQMHRIIDTALNLSKATQGQYDISIAPQLVANGLLPKHADMASRYFGNWQDIVLTSQQIYFRSPMLLDLGGIAKGYAVDCAFDQIAHKVDNLVINAGGDCRVKRWQDTEIAIKGTDLKGYQYLVKAPMQNAAVATSVHDHNRTTLVSPRCKSLVKKPYSATVFAEDCMTADAVTKIALLNPTLLSKLTQSHQLKQNVIALSTSTLGQLLSMGI